MSNDFESVDLDGRILRYLCAGEGTPTVVVDQGQGVSVEQGFSPLAARGWSRIFAQVQGTTQICLHDRAGLGRSDPPAGPRTSLDMVDDLRKLLRKAHIPPPYVLVGHSIGGFNVRLFGSGFPSEVSGMVLVDSSHPEQAVRMRESLPPESPAESAALRMLRHGLEPTASPDRIDARASADQVRNTRTFGLLPLVVLSQSPHAFRPVGIPPEMWDPIQRCWAELQADLVGLSSNSEHIVATHAGHSIPHDEPQLVIDAILKVVRAARSGKLYVH